MALLLHTAAVVRSDPTAGKNMAIAGIHRRVEFHAGAQPEATAVVDGERAMTYRELNARANVVARTLMSHGLRRSNVLLVRMPCSAELAVVLLAALKVGAAYCWIDPMLPSAWPPHGVSFLKTSRGDEQRGVVVDLKHVLSGPLQLAPNLPVMARAGDAACLIADVAGNPTGMVPHAELAALQAGAPARVEWAERAPFLLWAGLLSGGTVTVAGAGETATAAA
jgi:mycobactin peptide synthetase MbtE